VRPGAGARSYINNFGTSSLADTCRVEYDSRVPAQHSSLDNYLRAVRFERPDCIPVTFHINAACWRHYPHDRLFDLMEAHSLLFPAFRRPDDPFVPQIPPVARRDEPYTDDWGCVWETREDGITGVVTRHPLADWDDFARYKAPDPVRCTGIGPVDWAGERARIADAKQSGRAAIGGLRHGHTFLQLCDIRGYEGLTYDMADGEPRLWALIEMVETFNAAIVRRYLEAGANVMAYPENLGMQNGPMLSPEHFRTYVKPSYQRLMVPAREAGAVVHMHADGHLHALIDDIIEGGVQVINLQDLVNGIDWIAERFAGRVCVELDIDRQLVTPHGTPAEIDALVREEVEAIGSPSGGLMMVYGLYPGVPLGNVEALMDAMERYATHYS